MFMYFMVLILFVSQADASVDLWISKAETKRLLGFGTEIYYVQDGVVNLYAANFSMIIPASISTLHFNWHRKSTRKWRYQMDIELDRASMFSATSLSVPREGYVPDSPSMFALHAQCKANIQGEVELRLRVQLQAEISLTDSANRRRRIMTSSLLLRRRRVCRHSSDVISSNEMPQATRAFVSPAGSATSAPLDMWLHVVVGCVCGAALVATLATLAVVFRRKRIVSDCRHTDKRPDWKEVSLYSPVDCPERPSSPSHEYASVDELLYKPTPSTCRSSTINSAGHHYTEPHTHTQISTPLIEIKLQQAVLSKKQPVGTQYDWSRDYNYGPTHGEAGKSCDHCCCKRQNTRDLINQLLVSREQLQLECVLHLGSYCQLAAGWMVEDGDAISQKQRCLVKSFRDPACQGSVQEFLSGALTLGGLSHRGLQRVCGIVLDDKHPPALIYPHATHHSLKSLLRCCRWAPGNSTRSDRTLQLHNVVSMATQLADALDYLHLCHICHRDVATRNCCSDDLFRVKLSDAVCSHDLYPEDYTLCHVTCTSTNARADGAPEVKTKLLPVRWMAPEVLSGHAWSTSSDVWSYGVLLWELVSLAAQPYSHQLTATTTTSDSRNIPVSATQRQADDSQLTADIITLLREGSRLSQPDTCPDQLYMVMQHCWRWRSSDRPSSSQLLNSLLEFSKQLSNHI